MHRLNTEIPKELVWADRIVRLMDEQFKLPFINFRFGLDPLIGLVPWVGDLVSFAISALIVKSLVDAGLPRDLIWKMVLNIVIDLAIGAIPVFGDFWDFFNRANRKNLTLAKTYFENQIKEGSSTAHRHPTNDNP